MSGDFPTPAPADGKKDKFGGEYSPKDFLLVALLLYASLCLKKVLKKPAAGCKVPEGVDLAQVQALYAAGTSTFPRDRLEPLFNKHVDRVTADKLSLKQDITAVQADGGGCWVPDFTAARAATFACFVTADCGRKAQVPRAPSRVADKENKAAQSRRSSDAYLAAMYDFE